MRVLFACHRVPYPPRRGGKIRPFNIVRHLSEQGHQVTVASLARNAREADEAAGLRKHCHRLLLEVIPDWKALGQMLLNVPTRTPSSFGYFKSVRLARKVADAASEQPPDLVFAHCSSAAPYLTNIAAQARILDFGDMDSGKWQDYVTHRRFPITTVYALEAAKLRDVEKRLAGQFDLCTCTTKGELESLRALQVRSDTNWFPNGVDADYFAPAPRTGAPESIAFIGRMDYFPNQQAVQWFCRHVWPELRGRWPSLRLEVVGAEPTACIRDLASIEGVHVTGSVPDVRPYVQAAALTVAPLQIARGTQNKILESMALGTPVVASRQAAKGVDALAGEHLLVADSAQQWISVIDKLLGQPLWRQKLSHAARARILSHHSWDASLRRLDLMIEATLERKKFNEDRNPGARVRRRSFHGVPGAGRT